MQVILSEEQRNAFFSDGYLVVANAVTNDELKAMQEARAQWVEESRAHDSPYGPATIDGRPRFDMGTEHTPDHPALRRINNPSDIYPAYTQVMRHSNVPDMVADLVGPNIKFHHCKINLKCPGSATTVHYHQDFGFTPHSNDDVVTALILLDDMTLENGCLMVVPGSHKGPLYSLFSGDQFVGRIPAHDEEILQKQAVPIVGQAGSVCLMHTRLLHGSEANSSTQARGLYICVYSAEDAVPMAPNPMPNTSEGNIIRGHKTGKARMMELSFELPRQPKSASFFTVQGQASAR